MSRAGFRDATSWAVRVRSLSVRWVLLLAVLAGLFGMHVLTAEATDGGHGSLPTVAHVGHAMAQSVPADAMGHSPSAGSDAAVLVGSPLAVPGDAGVTADAPMNTGGMPTDHGGLGGCILFLAIGGTLMLLLTLVSRAQLGAATAWLPSLLAWGGAPRRGPPGRERPRVALCVIRV